MAVALVKNFVQPRFFPLSLITVRAWFAIGGSRSITIRIDKIRSLQRRGRGYGFMTCRKFDQLVQFAPVKPHAAALWTVINLNALAIHHCQSGIRADRTLHIFLRDYGGKIQRAATVKSPCDVACDHAASCVSACVPPGRARFAALNASPAPWT